VILNFIFVNRINFHLQQKSQEQKNNSIKNKSREEIRIMAKNHSQEKWQFSKQKLIIFCDPNHPIYFLEPFLQFISSHLTIGVFIHVHSTVTNFPNKLANFCSNFSNVDTDADISLTLIWKTIGVDPVMVLSQGMHEIWGIINIARYLNRLIESINASILKYERNDPFYATKIDSYLDKIHCTLYSGNIDILPKVCKKSCYVMGDNISIIDFILESINKYKLKK